VVSILERIFLLPSEQFGDSVLPQTLGVLEDAFSIPSSVLVNSSKRRVANELVQTCHSRHRFQDFYLSLADVLRIGPVEPAELPKLTALDAALSMLRPRPRPGLGSYNLEEMFSKLGLEDTEESWQASQSSPGSDSPPSPRSGPPNTARARRSVSSSPSSSEDSLAQSGSSLYENRLKAEEATQRLMFSFIDAITTLECSVDGAADWEIELDTSPLSLSTIRLGEHKIVSINDGCLVARCGSADGCDWRTVNPGLALVVLESKRKVRRAIGPGHSGLQEAGEMLSVALYRAKTLNVPARDLDVAQRTVILIGAEQSRLYFFWTIFTPEYLQAILDAERPDTPMIDASDISGGQETGSGIDSSTEN
jgi:hypothetical protein